MTPETTAGLALSAAAVGERVSVGAELWRLASRTRPGSAAGRSRVLPRLLSVLPCGLTAHWELLRRRAARPRAARASGFAEENFSTWKAFAAGGARGGFVDVGRVRFRARQIEGTGVAPTTGFFVGETAVYTTRGVSVAAGLDARSSFFP